MAWITITADDVRSILSQPEIEAVDEEHLETGQTSPLTVILSTVTKRVRAHVASGGNTLGATGTIPDELLSAALALIRFELLTRLPGDTWLNEDRRAAKRDAVDELKMAARGELMIVAPTTAATSQPSFPSPSFDDPEPDFDQESQEGV